MVTQSPNESQSRELKIGHQDSCPGDGRQGDMTHRAELNRNRTHVSTSIVAILARFELVDGTILVMVYVSGLIPSLRPANERRRYKVTPSVIGWAQT